MGLLEIDFYNVTVHMIIEFLVMLEISPLSYMSHRPFCDQYCAQFVLSVKNIDVTFCARVVCSSH